MLSPAQFHQIMPRLAPAKRALYLPALNLAMQSYGINTVRRTASFVAHLAHESDEFRRMEEPWGPTAVQRGYEPPAELANKLGNVRAGDGKLFKGRGPLQITGRANYSRYGGLLGIDLLANPALAATPAVAFATAGMYWQTNGLNELADEGELALITRRLSGATTSLAKRLTYFAAAKAALAAGFSAGALPHGAWLPILPKEALPRGFEAIRKAVRAGARAPAAARTQKPQAAQTAQSAQATQTATLARALGHGVLPRKTGREG